MFDQLGTDTYNKNIYQVVQVHADTYNTSYINQVQTHTIVVTCTEYRVRHIDRFSYMY